MHLRTILVPVDFSPASKNAFQYALHLAGMQGGRLVLFHAYMPAMLEPYMDFSMQSALLKQQEELALRFFARLEEEIPAELPRNFTLDYQMELGQAHEAILAQAAALKPDLIVMGAQGGNLLVHKLLGSTVDSVLQRAAVPVLVVPADAHFSGLRHIAYATDYEEDDIRHIDQLLYFAKQQGAHLSCVHIRQAGGPSDTYRAELLQRAYQHDLLNGHIDFQVMTFADVVEGLQHFAYGQEIDLLVMLTHHRSRIGHLFQKSYSRDMALHTHIPLWVYPMQVDTPVPASTVHDEYS